MVKINNSNKYDRHNKIKTIYKQSVIHKKKLKNHHLIFLCLITPCKIVKRSLRADPQF